MNDIISLAKKEIPSVDSILEHTWNEIGLSKKDISKDFNKSLILFDSEATKLFRIYEKYSILTLSKLWINSQKKDIKNRIKNLLSKNDWDFFFRECSKLFPELWILVQSMAKELGNMRKAREGKTFIKMISKLLNEIGINNSDVVSGVSLRTHSMMIPQVVRKIERRI